MDPEAMTEAGHEDPGERDDRQHHAGGSGPGVPGRAADSPAVQGSPVGPPD
ncbi:hypothetical protein AB0G04_32585 [Actinoplanes sp. NPDC023801]|uniref:hypothetical protein n=1 Tax=Actinoplanes sp. NPDC023801 TaxID=3154595 RepID=UPI0033BFC637